METVKIKNLPGFKRHTFKCEKCDCKVIVESDYLTDSAIKSLHKCRKSGGKSEKGK